MKQLAHHKRIYPLGEMENYDAEEPATETEDVFGGLVEEEVRLNGLDEKNNDFLIIPPRVLGYSTKEKLWGQFGIVSILPPEGKQPHKFRENLQLDDKYKELIEALVESHEANGNNGRRAVQDMVNDKGKGLVLLLHGMRLTRGAGLLFLLVLTHYSPVGPPGVGKTVSKGATATCLILPLQVGTDLCSPPCDSSRRRPSPRRRASRYSWSAWPRSGWMPAGRRRTWR